MHAPPFKGVAGQRRFELCEPDRVIGLGDYPRVPYSLGGPHPERDGHVGLGAAVLGGAVVTSVLVKRSSYAA